MTEMNADDLQKLYAKFYTYMVWRMENGDMEEEEKRLFPILKLMDTDFLKAARAEGWDENICKHYEEVLSWEK